MTHRFKLVPPEAGHVEFAPKKTLWLYALLGSTALLWARSPSFSLVASSMALALITLCAGHSVGLHRGIIHRSYRAPRWLRNLLVYSFVHTGIGGPLSWVRLHYVRDYYQNAAECPRYFGYSQSVISDYFWNLHLRFVPREPKLYGVPASEEHDPWLRFLDRTWALHVLALWLVIYLCFGLTAALTLVSARVTVSVIGHWLIGFLAHKYGYVRYELDGSPEIGRNLLLLGALSFGEGFHNNHHANPGSARMGEAWFELDLGWWLIRLLRSVGLIDQVRATGEHAEVTRGNARKHELAWRGAR
jgi:sn-1 stearoyl-lipid 9-desaturase